MPRGQTQDVAAPPASGPDVKDVIVGGGDVDRCDWSTCSGQLKVGAHRLGRGEGFDQDVLCRLQQCKVYAQA